MSYSVIDGLVYVHMVSHIFDAVLQSVKIVFTRYSTNTELRDDVMCA